MSKPEATWFNDCYKSLFDTPLSHWLQTLPAQLDHWQRNSKHGEFDKWCRLLAKLPSTTPSNIELDEKVAVGSLADVDVYTQKKISGLLQQFMPWRKGPFYVHDIHVDTEWRSDWKWDRVYPHITPLKNRTVLDVGCGKGEHREKISKVANYVGVDFNKSYKPEAICDLNTERLPFEDNTVTAIILDNAIEHFYDIPKVINELVRVSRKGTIIKIITPHFSSLSSWIDPTHIHHLSYFSFDHFEKSSNPQNYLGQGVKIQHKKLSFGGGVLGLTARLIFKISPRKYEQKYCFIFRASTLTFNIEVL